MIMMIKIKNGKKTLPALHKTEGYGLEYIKYQKTEDQEVNSITE